MKARSWEITIAPIASAISIATGGAALLWRAFAGVPSADWAYVRPNAALGLMLVGTALWFASEPRQRSSTWVGVACALTLGVLGVVTLAEYVLGVGLGIDDLLVV